MIVEQTETNMINSAPILKSEDIIDFISKYFNLQIEPQVLKKPECDNIYDLYSKILDRSKIIKIDNTNKLIYEGLNKLSYPGLHDNSIFLLKFFKKMKNFMNNTLLINDFQSSDIFNPDAKRTR